MALRNLLQRWKVQVRAGWWEEGRLIRDWANKLQDAWRQLRAWGEAHGDE